MNKPIIFIGGTAGTGKTSFARSICTQFDIDHRLGTGFVREIVKSQTSEKSDPALYRFTFDADDPVQNLIEQSLKIYSAVTACVRRARSEGTSLVIEGPHLIPSLYDRKLTDLFIILAAPTREEHYRRITGSRHILRSITEKDFENARLIDKFLRLESNKYDIPYLTAPDNVRDLISFIKKASNG